MASEIDTLCADLFSSSRYCSSCSSMTEHSYEYSWGANLDLACSICFNLYGKLYIEWHSFDSNKAWDATYYLPIEEEGNSARVNIEYDKV